MLPASPRSFVEVGLLAGTKQMSFEWGALRSHQELGLLLTGGSPRLPVQVAGDVLFSQVRANGEYGESYEIALGVRRNFPVGRFLPQVGAGATLVTASWQRVRAGADGYEGVGTDAGFWAGASARVRLGRTGTAGIHLRWTEAQVRRHGETIPVGGLHAGLTFAIGAPPRE